MSCFPFELVELLFSDEKFLLNSFELSFGFHFFNVEFLDASLRHFQTLLQFFIFRLDSVYLIALIRLDALPFRILKLEFHFNILSPQLDHFILLILQIVFDFSHLLFVLQKLLFIILVSFLRFSHLVDK